MTGSATVRAGERDLLGYGVVTAPSVPWAYDLPSVVRERRAADDRARHAAPDEGMAPAPARTPADPGAWRTEPVTELPALLASGIAPEQEAVQFWLDLGADPDASALAHALYVGTRVAAISHRRVELAVRGTTGLRFWPIEADGSLADVTPATSGGWEQLRRAVDAYTRAVDREAAAVAAQQPLDARLPDLRQQVAEADGNRRQRQLRMEEAEALHTAAHDTHTALVAEWNTRREELEQAGRDRTERKNEVTAAERDLAAADEVVRAATRAVVPAPDGTPAPESAAHALQRAEARQRDAVRALGAREEGSGPRGARSTGSPLRSAAWTTPSRTPSASWTTTGRNATGPGAGTGTPSHGTRPGTANARRWRSAWRPCAGTSRPTPSRHATPGRACRALPGGSAPTAAPSGPGAPASRSPRGRAGGEPGRAAPGPVRRAVGTRRVAREGPGGRIPAGAFAAARVVNPGLCRRVSRSRSSGCRDPYRSRRAGAAWHGPWSRP